MQHYDYGAVARTFKLNTSTLAQSTGGVAADFPNIGIHMQIGVSPDSAFQNAWDQYVRETYTSLQAVANRTVNYSLAQLNAYLQLCFQLDAALSEARRDMLMIQFRDVFSELALADYFGPNYQQVYSRAQADGTGPWFRWNTAAARIAAEFPHMHPKFVENYSYLLGNVFKDDDKGRWQFIYFHHFNQSLTSANPSYTQALEAVENSLMQFDNLMNTNAAPSLTRIAVNAIRADLLNTYGAMLNYDYGTVVNFYSAPEPIFDADLIAQLNNWHIMPRAILPGTTAPVVATVIAPESAAAAIDSICTITEENVNVTPWYNTGFGLRFQGPSTGNFDPYMLGMGMLSGVPFRVSGTAFEGAAALDLLAFHELPGGSYLPAEHVISTKPVAPFGITFGQFWIVNRSPLDLSYYNDFLTPSVYYKFEGTSFMSVSASFFSTLSAFNTSDAGNVLAYPATAGGLPVGAAHYFSEPVQSWALISESTLSTYAAGAARALFDVGTTRLKIAKTAERITRNNASAITERSSYERNKKGTNSPDDVRSMARGGDSRPDKRQKR